MRSSREIVETTEFRTWRGTLQQRERAAVHRKLEFLRAEGPILGRPHVDHVKGSRYPNMKELHVVASEPIRILFCFDKWRRAVLLVGGSKRNQDDWYRTMVPHADKLMNRYLEEKGDK